MTFTGPNVNRDLLDHVPNEVIEEQRFSLFPKVTEQVLLELVQIQSLLTLKPDLLSAPFQVFPCLIYDTMLKKYSLILILFGNGY